MILIKVKDKTLGKGTMVSDLVRSDSWIGCLIEKMRLIFTFFNSIF